MLSILPPQVSERSLLLEIFYNPLSPASLSVEKLLSLNPYSSLFLSIITQWLGTQALGSNSLDSNPGPATNKSINLLCLAFSFVKQVM